MPTVVTKETLLETAAKIYAAMEADKQYDIEVKVHKNKRSLDANGYFWTLCTLLSEKLKITKEEAYRKQVKEVGICDIIQIKEEAFDSFVSAWKSRGLGWFCERLDYSMLRGYINISVYCGSSVYDTKQMSRLIDNIVEECKEQGIETLPPDEIERLLSDWRSNDKKN